MRPKTESEVQGKAHEVKGGIKRRLGKATTEPNLEGEGAGEKMDGKIQDKNGHAQEAVEKP